MDLKLTKYKIVSINIPDGWTHFYGITSLIGLVITIFLIYNEYIRNKKIPNDFNFVLTALTWLLIVMLFIFFLMIIYYNKKLSKTENSTYELNNTKLNIRKKEIIIKQVCECSHVIAHYYRNIEFEFQNLIDFFNQNKIDDITNEDLIYSIERFDYFLINVSSSLQSYFSQLTGDNCSVTIKLLNKEDKSLVAFFRDPVNFKKRRELDKKTNKTYAKDNTATALILDENFSNTYFADDDLNDLKKRGAYKNPNEDFGKYYNATIVTPISFVEEENKRNTIGFLSVDNHIGNLATIQNSEYLFFVSDLLYSIFKKYDKIINIANLKKIENDRIKRYTTWS